MSDNQLSNPIKTLKKDKPLILAHRGLVTEYPENTMPAIQGALNNPHCDGAEFDVFLTKDNKVVLFHDENMKRLTGVDKSIYDMTWADLQTISIQKTIEVDEGVRHYHKEERIPLLSDVLEEIKGKDFFVDIEIKAYSPKWSKRHTGTEVASVIRACGSEGQAVCTSFDFFMLYCLEKEHGDIRSGFAYDDDMPLRQKWLNWIMERNLIGKWVRSNAVAAEYTLIDDNSIQKYHKRGMDVGTYTLFPLTPPEKEEENTELYERQVKRLSELGVDWIETDNPKRVCDVLYPDGR